MLPGPAVGLVASSPVLTWAAGGRHDVDTYYAFGPYHVSYTLEIAILCGAVLLAAWSVWQLIKHRDQPPSSGLSGKSFLLLLMLGCFCAWSWRVMTAGVGGANIGAGLLVMVGPVIAAILLICAIAQQHKHRPMRTRLLAVLVSAAIVSSGLLMTMLLAVGGD